MNGLPYYKRFPRDFIEGTVGLPFELKVTYSFILDLIYLQGGNLPDDPRYIAGLLSVSVRKWNSLRNGLIEADKIQAENGYLTNYRAVIELESLAKLQDKQRENRLGGNKNKDLQKPRSHHTEPEPDTERKKGANAPYAREEEFEKWWLEYPKKAGKGQARKAYFSALKKTEAATLLSKLAEYRECERVQRGFVQNAATWLNGEGWLDEWEEPRQPEVKETYAEELQRRLGGDGANILRLEERR